MYNDLINFEKQRTGKEALGFYIAYLLLTILAIAILSGIVGVILSIGFDLASRLGWLVVVIFCPWLSYKIISKKNLKRNILYIGLCISSGIGALWMGGFLGLIPVAYLTTIPKIHLIDARRD
jgi:membrane-bound acyltransferase YfiQ involved in biofilm formation